MNVKDWIDKTNQGVSDVVHKASKDFPFKEFTIDEKGKKVKLTFKSFIVSENGQVSAIKATEEKGGIRYIFPFQWPTIKPV